MRKLTATTKKVFIGLAGTLVVLIGIALVPLPGPGWLVVFLGLTILGAEFDWAKRLHDWGKRHFMSWEAWMRAQSRLIQAMFGVLATLVMLVVLWLINSFGFANAVLSLGIDWLDSPFVR